MQFKAALIALVASLTLVSSTPAPGGLSILDSRGGLCNGCSCQAPALFGVYTNYPCATGSCCGPDGGDGTPCTVNRDGLGDPNGSANCPT